MTDMDSLVSISSYFFWKNIEIDSFSIPEALLIKFLVPQTRLTQSHTSLFWDFYYIINFYPSKSMG